MLGETPFTFEWISCYRFQCRRLARFRHGPVLFVGDAAHQVSPFGARGGNSGVQDVDNLGWKLDLVLRGTAPDALIDTYDVERRQAADENITASTRSTDFISPKGPGPTLFRDGVLALARHEPFARRLLNSGRLSTPTIYDGSPLNSPDGVPDGPPSLRPGAPALDAPLDATDGGGYLLDRLDAGFTLLRLGQGSPSKASAGSDGAPLRMLDIGHSPAAHHRYDAEASDRVYLIRPDQHVAARWACLDHASVATALGRALARRAL
jgi:3-(3-hydroxy-phenyl)propionate hydroxylase